MKLKLYQIIALIILTILPIIGISLYELETGNHIGWYGFGFMPIIFADLDLLIEWFIHRKEN